MQNRVNEIRETVPVSSWSHCPGSLNPADIPSRGVTAEELARSILWRNGLNLSRFPTVSQSNDMPNPCITEMKAHTLIAPARAASIGNIVDIEHFSTLQRLYRVTAYVFKFANLLRTKPATTDLTPHHLQAAEKAWVKDCQLKLEDKNWKAQFGLFRDNNQIWRCGG